jgi:hypothetical protein
MSKESAIKAVLTGSTAWTTLVTGGTFLYEELGRTGLTPDSAAAAGCYDANGLLELTAVLTFGATTEAEILTSESQFMRLWLYADSSYSNLRSARRVAKNLLDGVTVNASATGDGWPLLRWVDDQQEFTADELGGAMACASRYRVLSARQ